MTFNSLHFVVYFIIVTIVYFALKHKYRWIWLLGISCYFYMYFIPYYILVLALAIIIDYSAGIMIERSTGKSRKLYLYTSVISTCAILFVFKYFGFFNDNVEALARALDWNYSKPLLKLALPIGLSFHTFQSLSYVFEVYRGNYKAEKHLGIYALYVMFYPQLVAGPIERPQNLLHQFREPKKFDYRLIRTGLFLMLWGMFKKVVIADRLSMYVNVVFSHPNAFHGWPSLMAAYAFFYQIYCDFSGYSDIAVGAAMVMGFKLMTNFRFPFTSASVTEFWRKWHISLTTWFRDYIYIPRARKTKNKFKRYYFLFMVFFLSGVWHGAAWHFIVWGMLNGALLVLEAFTLEWRNKLFKISGLDKLPGLKHFLSVFITFHIVCFTGLFFGARSLSDAFTLFKSIFRASPIQSIYIPGIHFSELLLAAFFLISMTAFENYLVNRKKTINDFVLTKPIAIRWAIYMILFTCIFAIGNLGNVQFAYFQF